ncbi:MAG: glycosyltransferase family 2 protein [Flavobacterium sp.]|uniref:glycosyltransferase family 2 protein n=1 Tax=Flavobacterium sp. TaxID=239 RepID=UPI0022C93DBD|nr:glycosyltransferase family 2 protein [Flavobacterium sp.]MCZ8197293.1 glycosyltransferase family 2 protein [Flavobacterium sp.]
MIINPTVTIIMATYNRARYIKETLVSIQNQTYENWECIIIDDGGTDNTKDVIALLLEKDTRFQFVKRKDSYKKGLPGCRNYGLDLAKGEYIIFFDDDDIVHPQNLEITVLELSKNDVSFCRYIREGFYDNFNYDFDFSKNYTSFFIDKHDVFKLLNQELPFNSCQVLWKKECFKDNKYTEYLLHAEEWELYSRILSTGIRGISIDKTLFFARRHSDSMTGQYFRLDTKRTKSNVDAILLVIQNLQQKSLITNSLLRYFIQISLEYKEYKLFEKILETAKLSFVNQIRLKIFYVFLPLRLYLYRIKKKIVA